MKTRLQKAFLNAYSLLAVLLASSAMTGQVTLPGTSPYSENFNTTPGASGTSYPTGWASYDGTTVDNAMNVGNAASVSGANYNYGSRIGILGSGSAFSPSSIVLRIANTSGKTGLKISYDVVKIREQARSNSFNLEVSTTSATAGFTSVTGGSYASGSIAEGTSTAFTNIDISSVDNTSGNVWIRWSYTEISGSGSRDGIALDNVSVSWGASAPAVTTSTATSITASSATLRGTINANGQIVATSFNWGTTTSYGSSVAGTPSSATGTSVTNITAGISSLSPNTQYNYRVVGTVSGTPTNGANSSFYTLAKVPGILTVNNAAIFTLDVTVNATTQNGNPAATQYAIREDGGSYVQADGSLDAAAVWQTAAQWATVTVIGLTDNTTYGFSAKARNNAGAETAFGTSASGTTLVNTNPTLTVSTLAGFGDVCVFHTSEAQSFTIDGINLTADDIVVGPLDGFTFSLTETGTYVPTLNITQSGGTFSGEVFVRFEPTDAIAYGGNIDVVGGAADAVAVAASGTGINTLSQVNTTSAMALTASTAEVGGEVISEGCAPVTEKGIVYSTTSNPELGGTDVTNVVSSEVTAAYTVSLSALAAGTVYYTKAYSTTAAGTSYGTELTFTTADVVAPVATAATDVNHNSFTANWDASEGAVSYRLDVSESATFGTSAPATDLFFSEYAEGSSTNKYLEIYNGTGASVDLSDYRVKLYSNGSTSTTGTSNDVQLSGTLANGNTVVIRNSGATIYSGTATVVASVNFNGNDAVALYKISTASNVDIFGRIGENPGSAWTSGSISTLDKTLVRKSSVISGVTSNPTSGFPTLGTEWNVLDQNDVTNLGSHTFAGIAASFVAGYENLEVSGLSASVTGLTSETDYYYRVRAVAGNTSANSNTISVTTLVNTTPTLSVTPLASFGSACIFTIGEINSMTVSGINLTNADIIVGPLSGFTFSTSATGPFTSSVLLTQPGGTYSQEVFVRFQPIEAVAYTAEVEIDGGGASSVLAVVDAVGLDTVPTIEVTNATEGISDAEVDVELISEGCSDVIERGVVYATTIDPEIGGVDVINIPDAGTSSDFTASLSGLFGGTTYYVRAYAVNNGGTAYSESFTLTTMNVAAPLAIDASDILADGFTANWEASEGAQSYRLDVSESATFGTVTPATDLFFSEYTEGSSSNKYLEIYNGTGASVDLSDYRVRLYSNGSTSATGTSNDVQLSGSLANGSTVVIRNSAATVYTGTATVVASVNFNGDDAVALYKISTSSNVDIFGRIGEDPGTAWTSGSLTTVDKTLVRKSSVTSGVTINPTSGFPTLATEWDVLDQNDVTDLGAHTFSGSAPSFVAGYENLEVSGLSQVVTGLNSATTYYFRVRAVAGNTSDNSNTISVTTDSAFAKSSLNSKGIASNNTAVVYKQANVLNIHTVTDAIASVKVYDLTGKQLFASSDINRNDIELNDLSASNQVLVVKVMSVTNELFIKKVQF
ncbi:lamin tail domain-containing protein [Flavobacterium sp. MAH-1]|uniref:Lamin tail domain-containing protein n=1 Tax=Flavobacterium agri TaxID=2743471 RepID=A0A7Y9C4Z2_9FLAO|nr:lamin tail domain-containing protein [Flavobacterium agri]NUY79834.1 lamin tail domain-containing protein [Flavobacterium agri]NYA69859.1 lamin tail domain-containing protein [Flavobacterium agri]